MNTKVIVDLSKIVIGPYMTVETVADMCKLFSTENVEVSARIEFVNDKPVAYLISVDRSELPPNHLRK